jgi:hypothetical protein
MKSIIQFLLCSIIAMATHPAFAQKADEERMRRDVAVAENILGTIIKQEFERQKMFFPLEIKTRYQQGYGITFYIPADYTTPIVFSLPADNFIWQEERIQGPGVNLYNYEDNRPNQPAQPDNKGTIRLADKSAEKSRIEMDSVRDAYNARVIEAAKRFLADYGDMMTELAPTERIIISNQGDRRAWVNQYFNAPKRSHLSVEALKEDLTQYRQNKITRDQLMSKIKVVNTQAVDEVEPDLELLSSIFTRLYRPDLSKTFFVQENIYFERLKDYGVVYYMQALSSQELGYSRRYIMPTIGLEDVDQATRDKKIKELYPKFESELKDNILEYGRTLKSLGDNEVLLFQVRLTRCAGCGIPSTVDYSIKAAVLRDLNAGKITKSDAVTKFEVRKGEAQ